MKEYLDAIWEHLNSSEQRVFFGILRYSGEKFSLILQLRAKDVYYCEATPREKIRFAEKRNTYLFSIPETLREILKQNPIRINLPENKYLFPHKTKNDEPIAIATANSWISNACARAYKNGLDIPHRNLKMYILQELYQSGMSLAHCKRLLAKINSESILVRLANNNQTFEQFLESGNILG